MSALVSQEFLPDVGKVLGQLVSQDATASTAPQFNTRAIKSQVVVYYLPASATTRNYRMVMTVMTLCGRCQDDRPDAWQSFVLTWSALCFPELIDAFKNDGNAVDYVYREFPKSFIDDCEQAVRAQTSEETAGKVSVTFPPELPNAGVIPLVPELIEAAEIEGLYSYYSMLVFMMGKSINSNNLSSLASKRPSALIRKRQLYKCEYILTGEGKPSQDNYGHIQSGWVRSTRPRITIVKHLAQLYAAPNRSETLDTISVNMDMLRNAGQTYMFYIHELLVACPWAIEIPALRSAYYHYAKMVKVLSAQPEWFQPFYKLAMQDSTRDIRRKDVEALISVAAFFAAQTRKTMSQYRISSDTYPVIAAFRKLAAERGLQFEEVANQQTTETSAI